jgi:hypothetical protein
VDELHADLLGIAVLALKTWSSGDVAGRDAGIVCSDRAQPLLARPMRSVEPGGDVTGCRSPRRRLVCPRGESIHLFELKAIRWSQVVSTTVGSSTTPRWFAFGTGSVTLVSRRSVSPSILLLYLLDLPPK